MTENYKNIKIDKSLYNSGKTFSQMLEKLDPSAQYAGTELEGSDAFQRQLKRFDIKVSGENSDKVEKFFSTAESAVLFPEYVSRAVKQGISAANAVDDLVAAKTIINGLDYRSLAPQFDENDKTLSEVAEGASIPQVELKVAENLVRLTKRGKLLVASYEAIRYQRIDLFTIALKQIGAHIAKTQLKDLYAHINKEYENHQYSVTTLTSDVTYSDLLSMMLSFGDYDMNTIVCSPNTAKKLYAIDEFKAAMAHADYPLSGEKLTPFGAKLVVIEGMSDKLIAGVDKNYAFEYVQAGDVISEYDKLIDRQLERASITVTSGFSTIYTDAVKIIKTN